MGRRPRVEHPGATYHVTSRATGFELLVRDDLDRSRLLHFIARTVVDQDWRCHAYCLMSNHFHLVITTPAPTLATGMHWLKTRYSTTFNRRYGRRGTLFGNRYHAQPIDQQSHMLEACVYVVLNPVRAGLVAHPRDWLWSSYRATAGLVEPPVFLDADSTRELLVSTSRDRDTRYAEIVDATLGAWHRSSVPGTA